MWRLLSVTVQEEEKACTRCVFHQEECTVKGRKRIFLKKQTYCFITVNNIFFYRGDKLLNRMYELVRQIWEEERIPEEWKEIIIVPIHKRGDRQV